MLDASDNSEEEDEGGEEALGAGDVVYTSDDDELLESVQRNPEDEARMRVYAERVDLEALKNFVEAAPNDVWKLVALESYFERTKHSV